MGKSILTLAATGLLLSGCAVTVEGGPHRYHGGDQSSLTINAGTETEMTVNCSNGREPYSEGGDNGEPLVMGCRDYEDGPSR